MSGSNLVRTRARSLAPWVALALAFVAIGALAAPGSGGSPLDPAAPGPQGAKALALLLRQYGAGVAATPGVPGPDTTVALVLTDQLDDARRSAVADWVRRGGTLVVADPASSLQPGVPVRSGRGLTSTDLRPGGLCGLTGLESIHRLDAGASFLLRPPPGTRRAGCFRVDHGPADASFLLAAGFGRGTVVGLGGAGLWTNARLGQEDNAALALALLAAGPASQVAILVPSRPGSGSRSGLQLAGPRVREALVQLLIAFGVLAWWRGRRLGDPVPEHQPVDVDASELVGAVGNLLARTASVDAAATELRAATRRTLAERLGLGIGATPEQIAAALAGRLGLDHDAVRDQLRDGPVADDAGLVRLAAALAQLRQEVIRARTP